MHIVLTGVGVRLGHLTSMMASRWRMVERQLKLCCLLVPWHLLERMSERDLILLSASPNAGAGMVDGIGKEERRSDAWAKHYKRK
jgi:hypothetical protein